jgi:hypothetical protein
MKLVKCMILLCILGLTASIINCSTKQIVVHLVCVPVPMEAYDSCVNLLMEEKSDDEEKQKSGGSVD